MAKVTIGLPVYNGASSLARALECLTKQTFTDLDIIISNNASTDNTAEICKIFAATDKRITCHDQPELLPVSDNFGFVLQQASSEFFMWAAADDAWEPEFIARLLEAIETDKDTAISFANIRVVDLQGAPVSDLSLDWLGCTTHQAQIRAFLVADPIMGACNLMYGLYRREILLQCIQQFFWTEGEHFGADYSFILFALLKGKYTHVPAALFLKTAGGISWSMRSDLSAWEKFSHVKSMYLDAWRVLVECEKLTTWNRAVAGIMLIYGLGRLVATRLMPAGRFNKTHILSKRIARASRTRDG